MTTLGTYLLVVGVIAAAGFLAWLFIFLRNQWLHYRADRWFAQASDADLIASFVSRDRMELVAEIGENAITALRLKFRVMPPALSRKQHIASAANEFSREQKLLLTTDVSSMKTQLETRFKSLRCSLAGGWDDIEQCFATAPIFEYEQPNGLRFRRCKEKTLRIFATRDSNGGLILSLEKNS